MPDRRRIIRQWRDGAASVFVTLVRAEGSSYRRPGAHLLIGPNGEYSGSISGGCLEAEIVRKAAWMVHNGAIVERYSTLFDDTADIPYGLGCGGIVDLLLEPAGAPECRALLMAMQASLTGSASHIATWLPQKRAPLRRAIFAPSGSVIFASETLSERDIETARAVAADANIAAGVLPDETQIYLEHLSAPQRLIVLGAGEDAKPVVTLASLLGWRVVVADGRAQLAQPPRFPEAERVIALSATLPLAELSLRANDAAVLMTHSYEQDRALLTQLLAPLCESQNLALPSREIPSYIGLLGASHRSSLLISEVAASLGITIAECCAHVCAPVGLDLGGDGAEAIALALIAEVQAHIQGRLASSRKLTAARIAGHIAQGGASRYLHAQCAFDSADVASK
jgi:xanthine/CO dehydrogenase XdhC/CoxF family maturation factor